MRPAHIAFHNIFRAIIYLPLYLPCFFLCLQFKQKIAAQALPTLGDDDDDDGDDDENPLAHSSTPEPAHPPAVRPTASSSSTSDPAVHSTSGDSKTKRKEYSPAPGDPDIIQLLLQHQERSHATAGELRELVTQAPGPVNTKSAWGSFLHSNLPQIHDRIWPLYLKMEMENYMWALNELNNISQQPQHPVPHNPPLHQPPKCNSLKSHIRCNLSSFNPFSIKSPTISNTLFSSSISRSTHSSNTSISKLNSMQLRLYLLLRLAR